MKFAVISDIHGNLEALNTVLIYLKTQKIDQIFCLGDVVGYGPYPVECLEKIQKECQVWVLGNHDYSMINDDEISRFNEYAKVAAVWTKKVLNKQH